MNALIKTIRNQIKWIKNECFNKNNKKSNK
jgi:hypothetical protein